MAFFSNTQNTVEHLTPVRSAREMGKYMLIIFLFIGLALCDEEDPGSRRYVFVTGVLDMSFCV